MTEVFITLFHAIYRPPPVWNSACVPCIQSSAVVISPVVIRFARARIGLARGSVPSQIRLR